MPDIFFSYKSEDRERVRPIRDAFAAEGFEVFWDQQVPVGADWDSWIRQHLERAKCAIVFWSAASVASDNVRHEATVAKQQGKLISVLLEPLAAAQFPMGLYTQQAAVLSSWEGDPGHEGWTRLQREVEAKLTPVWVQRRIHELEAELMAERARRIAAEGRDKALQVQIAKEAHSRQEIQVERDEAAGEIAALKARLAELTGAGNTPKTHPENAAVVARAERVKEQELPPLITKADNFILTVGLPASGKSTFQNFLVRYVVEGCQDFIVEPRIGGGADDGQILLVNWREIWREGRFPPPNARGTPKQYSFHLTAAKGSRFTKNLDFSFIEVSGDELRTVVMDVTGQPQKLPAHFMNIFEHEGSRTCIVLTCDGAELMNHERNINDDRLFVDFLRYIECRFTPENFRRLRQDCRIMILVSKPQRAYPIIEMLDEGKSRTEGSLSERVVQRFLNETYREIRTKWSQEPLLTSLYIGTIDKVEDEFGMRERLKVPDYDDIKTIFDKVYRHFTQKSSKLGWWRSI